MNKPSRVLHIIESLGLAGTEHQLVRNIGALDRSSFVSFVCYLKDTNNFTSELSRLGVPSFCLGVRTKREWIGGVYRLSRYIKTNKIDLVHTNLYESDILGGIAAKLSGVRAISTFASPADSSEQFLNELHLNKYKLRVSGFLRKVVYKTCFSHFIAVSEHTKSSWVKSGLAETRVKVIPRGVEKSFTEIEPAVSIDERKSDSYPLLLNVGRLIPHKGQRYLIEAMPTILKRYPKARLLIAGEGPLRSDLEKLSETLGLKSAVFLLGRRNDIKELLVESDMFVFPSLSEGFPGALLEAAALGKPCIASNIPPVLEIVEDGVSGLLVDTKSPEALARAILRLSFDKAEAQTLGSKARESSMRKFLIDNTVKDLETLYSQVLGNKSSGVKTENTDTSKSQRFEVQQ